MHQSSMAHMAAFRDAYLKDLTAEPLTILDVGSADINGSYRTLFENPAWRYVGADLAPGKNVDVVLKDPYHWTGIASESTDVLVSGQALEHIEYHWMTMLEIVRVLRPGGLCCLIAPSGGFEHRYPVDCWRFYPDGFLALARFSGMVPLECRCSGASEPYTDHSNIWKDTVMVARKPPEGFTRKWKRRLLQHVLRMMSAP